MSSVSHDREESSYIVSPLRSQGEPGGVCQSSRMSSVFFLFSSSWSSCSCVGGITLFVRRGRWGQHWSERASDPAFRRELDSIKKQTLIAFNDKIEGFEQAIKTESSSAHGLAAKGTPTRRNQNPSNPKNMQRTGQPRGVSERSRRLALRVRWAREDHMLPQCSYPVTVKCNTCNGSGHILPACGKRQAANAAKTQISAASASSLVSSMHQLAIGYDGPTHSSPPANISHAVGASSNWGSQSTSSRAGVFYTPSSQPTPEMPL